ncbi:hypothetical protein [Streptomyces clavifer]|uniref:hypothetical protein n=1 Tax=Streptomyces clavifer TaxID=68188 RepID=UPI0033C6A7BA
MAFAATAGATFGFIATGVDATTAVGVSLSCTLAAERLVQMASRPSRRGGPGRTGDDETEAS